VTIEIVTVVLLKIQFWDVMLRCW